MFERIAIIGGGNGGKAAAAELTLRGERVRLFEFPEFRSNLEELTANLNAEGVLSVKGTEMPPPPPKPLAEPLVKEYMGKYLEKDPALRQRCRKRPKARAELREMVIAKHGKRRSR